MGSNILSDKNIKTKNIRKLGKKCLDLGIYTLSTSVQSTYIYRH
jgi:hypothetical protein